MCQVFILHSAWDIIFRPPIFCPLKCAKRTLNKWTENCMEEIVETLASTFSPSLCVPPRAPVYRQTAGRSTPIPALQNSFDTKISTPDICQVFILYSAWDIIFRPPKGGTTREARLEEGQQRLTEICREEIVETLASTFSASLCVPPRAPVFR